MSPFPDTGPGEDGRRSHDQWMNAMGEDVALVRTHMRTASQAFTSGDREVVQALAIALKEARRMGNEVFGVSRSEIDKVRT